MIDERKKFIYRDHEYAYRVYDAELLPSGSLCIVTVVGGPRRRRAHSSCPRSDVKDTIKKLVAAITPKKLGVRTRAQQLKTIHRTRSR